MKIKNPIMFWLFIIFVIANIVDAITAYFILPGEANPLYLMTGSIVLIDIIKIVFALTLFYFYQRNVYPSNFYYFLLLMVLGLGSLVVGLGAYSNILGMLNPHLVTYASNLTTGEKTRAYINFVTVIYLLPMAISLIIFKLYDLSLKAVKIDKEYFKKREWWKI